MVAINYWLSKHKQLFLLQTIVIDFLLSIPSHENYSFFPQYLIIYIDTVRILFVFSKPRDKKTHKKTNNPIYKTKLFWKHYNKGPEISF